jgi:hypothetical protein
MPFIPAVREAKVVGSLSEAVPRAKTARPYALSKNKKELGAWLKYRVLPSKDESLNSNPNTTKNKMVGFQTSLTKSFLTLSLLKSYIFTGKISRK